MRKTYFYKNLSFPVADNEDVNLTVEFVSDGNIAQTIANVPGPNDKSIQDEGTECIGKGKELRNEFTVIFSDVSNPAPEENHIRIKYYINDELIVLHENPKSEEDRPYIAITIKFPSK